MGNEPLRVAYGLKLGQASTKAVLCALAWRACGTCGTTWAGVKALAADTDLSPNTVTRALSELVHDNRIIIGRYPNGGRGVSTEYVVLPGLWELSTPPCGRCRGNMRNPPAVGWYYPGVTGNHTTSVVVSAETTPTGPPKPHHGGVPTGITTQQEGSASPRADETSLTLGPAFDHPADDPSARLAAQDALQSVRGLTMDRNPETAPTGQQRKAEATQRTP